MPKLPQSLDDFTTSATVDEIDAALASCSTENKDLINFWLDLRLMVSSNNNTTEKAVNFG